MQLETKYGKRITVCLILSVVLIVALAGCSVMAIGAFRNASNGLLRAEADLRELKRELSIQSALLAKWTTTPLAPTIGNGIPEETDTQSPESEQTTDSPTTAAYLIRECNGQIGIYSADGCFLRIVHIPVATLPSDDREQLKAGIPVSDAKQLNILLSDLE